MIALGLVKLQCADEGLEDAVRDAGEIPPLEPRVVVHADSGEQRDFLTPESRNPAIAPVNRQSCVFGGDLRAARRKELARLQPVVHTTNATAEGGAKGGTGRTSINRALPHESARVFDGSMTTKQVFVEPRAGK